MNRWSERRQAFRNLLDSDICVHPASVHDPVSVRIAQDLGFELGMFAGSVASLTVLGAPDMIVLTLSEFAGQAYRISRAGELPILVDADHGYGNALNVMRTVEELEAAGIAGLSIEDTALPQGFASGGVSTLITIEEGTGKMRAAVEARRDPSLAIAARTSAAAMTGPEDAARRVRAYSRTGVDAIFLVGVKTRPDLELIAAESDLPIIVGGTGPDLADTDYLASKGVRVALQGHQPFAAATQAIYQTMKHLREGGAPSALNTLASADLMKSVSRRDDYQRWIEEFLN